MGRILAIDYGKRRTGLAVTDALQIVPGALATVETPHLKAYLDAYVAKEPVECVVIGMPVQPNGRPSENLQRVRTFVGEWRKAHPDIPIEGYDERFTSVLAHRAIIDAGLGMKARADKERVDSVAATIILQDYLNSRDRKTR